MKGSPKQTTTSLQELALYEELLECLEEESQALVCTREEAIYAAAARKKALLERLLELKQSPTPSRTENPARLEQLKRQVAAANARNRKIAKYSLELIREFLAQFQPPGPGLYQLTKPATAVQENALFKRRA